MDDFEVVGLAGVDSGRLLIIDPSYIENDEMIAAYVDQGLAVIVETHDGDGLYPVVDFGNGSFLIDTKHI